MNDPHARIELLLWCVLVMQLVLMRYVGANHRRMTAGLESQTELMRLVTNASKLLLYFQSLFPELGRRMQEKKEAPANAADAPAPESFSGPLK